MKPRMLWFCQSVALAISAIVAPLGRRRRSRTIAFFENSRGTLASFTLAAFLLAGLASFFAASFAAGAFLLVDLASLAAFLALGAPPFLLAPFFEVAFSGATGAPCSATAAVSVVLVASACFMLVSVLSAVDARMTIYYFGGPGRQGGSSTSQKKVSMAISRCRERAANMASKLADRREKRGKRDKSGKCGKCSNYGKRGRWRDMRVKRGKSARPPPFRAYRAFRAGNEHAR